MSWRGLIGIVNAANVGEGAANARVLSSATAGADQHRDIYKPDPT